MKSLFFTLFFFPIVLFSQKETVIREDANGFKIVHHYTQNDTLEYVYYPDGQLFSSKKAFPGNEAYVYKRLYPNGSTMYERSLLKGIADGTSIFYNEKGRKVITVLYSNGSATDTIVHTTKQTVVFGNYSYSSIVYGGAQNEDGSSNIHEVSSSVSFCRMKLVAQPFTESSRGLNTLEMITDMTGDFMIVLNTRKQIYGIFPSTYPDSAINNKLFPADHFGGSSSTSWSLSQELKLDWNTPFIYTVLKSSSVGYAP
jgi:hypothetical protein